MSEETQSEPKTEDLVISPSSKILPLITYLFFQVENAVKFLVNPRLASSPMSQKRAFLKSKGLTDGQIDEACAKAGINPSQEFSVSTLATSQKSHRNWSSIVKEVANFIVIFGGASYGLVYIWKVIKKNVKKPSRVNEFSYRISSGLG